MHAEAHYDARDLGSINLTRLICDPFTPRARLDFVRLAAVVSTAVRLLDHVIDVSHFPLRQGARILVTDDEPDLELLVMRCFRRQIHDGEFGFTFANDGVSGVAALAADPEIDLLLCDNNMPLMED